MPLLTGNGLFVLTRRRNAGILGHARIVQTQVENDFQELRQCGIDLGRHLMRPPHGLISTLTSLGSERRDKCSDAIREVSDNILFLDGNSVEGSFEQGRVEEKSAGQEEDICRRLPWILHEVGGGTKGNVSGFKR